VQLRRWCSGGGEAERAYARLLVLLECSTRLARARTVHDAVDVLASMVVPGLADWTCIAWRAAGGDAAVTLAVSHRDRSKQGLLHHIHRPDPDESREALRGLGVEPTLHDDITPEGIATVPLAWPIGGVRDPEHARALKDLGLRSLLHVPIRGQDGVAGVMALASAVESHRYLREDVLLAQDLADQAAVALESARQLADASDAAQARAELLSSALHKLRTPLTPLLLHLQLLARALDRGGGPADPATEHARRAAASCQREAQRMGDVISELLDAHHSTRTAGTT
jgi:GAF domain-containing protein